MPTNEQRRATAKRKLERQLERRAAKAAQASHLHDRRIRRGRDCRRCRGRGHRRHHQRHSDSENAAATGTPTTSAEPAAPGALPAFAAPAGLGDNCQYPASADKASKADQAAAHRQGADRSCADQRQHGDQPGQHRPDAGQRAITVHGEQLRQPRPAGLLQRHPLSPADHLGALSVLQCGDPTGEGTGGPGYQFANEYPTNQYQPDDPKLNEPVVYPRGTLAMANAGPGTNGSQFFLVYKDSKLPPNYTVFGTIDETGLATLDKIGAPGTADGGEDGKPKPDVKIKSLLLDPDEPTTAVRRLPAAVRRHTRRPTAIRRGTPAIRRRSRRTRWPLRRWCARSCSHLWASCSGTCRCRRSRKRGEDGRGLALAGLIIELPDHRAHHSGGRGERACSSSRWAAASRTSTG